MRNPLRNCIKVQNNSSPMQQKEQKVIQFGEKATDKGQDKDQGKDANAEQ